VAGGAKAAAVPLPERVSTRRCGATGVNCDGADEGAVAVTAGGEAVIAGDSRVQIIE
jgi:hypothetical protein